MATNLDSIDFTRDGSADPKMLARYDSALISILSHEGKLESFMDVFFGFLFRKTDYFRTMTAENQTYGFPPGVAEKMLLSYFRKYKTIALRHEAATEQKKKETNKKEMEQKVQADEPKEVTVETKKEPIQNTPITNVQVEPQSELVKQQEEENFPKKIEKPKTQEAFQANPDSYNGAIRDKYMWSQNYDDVDIKVPVTKEITRGKQVQVAIERKHIKVSIQNGTNWDVVMNDDLEHEVKCDESMWSLMPGKEIEITLTKDTNFWWKKLLSSEDEIDINKIAPERSMADMAEDELAVINKLQFDERQKRLGLPQSHEMKAHDMLKKGWDAEGSPFKGQQFDPKMFNIAPSSIE